MTKTPFGSKKAHSHQKQGAVEDKRAKKASEPKKLPSQKMAREKVTAPKKK